MVRHQQKFFILRPRVVFADHRCQFGDAPGRRIALEKQMQQRHEMTLATPEAAVQIAGFARLTL